MEASTRRARLLALRAAVPCTLPVLMGFLVLGVAYGVLMQSRGYGVLWSTLMSAVAFCGSMQYVALTLLTMAFDPLQAFLMSLMVNARHLFYGLSMLEKYRGAGRRRFPLIYLLCDETYSIVSSIEPPPDVDRYDFYLSVSVLDYAYWVLGTALGGLLGGALTSVDLTGLDFALTALFVVLLLEQWKKKENRPSALIGLGCAALCLLLFGADAFLLPALGCILAMLLLGRNALCR